VSDGYQFSIHLIATSLLSLRLNARRGLYRRCRLTMAKQHWRQIKCAQTRIQSDRFAAYKDTFLDMTIHWLSPIRTSSVERLAVSGRRLLMFIHRISLNLAAQDQDSTARLLRGRRMSRPRSSRARYCIKAPGAVNTRPSGNGSCNVELRHLEINNPWLAL
jgi:hypothetical protein